MNSNPLQLTKSQDFQKTVSIAVFCLVILPTTATMGQSDQLNELRTWRDTRGNEIEARLVRFKPPTVYLRDKSRRTFQIPPGRLSKPDQDYILRLLRKQKKDELAATFAELAAEGQVRNQPSASSGTTPDGSGAPPSPKSGNGNPPGSRANPPRSGRSRFQTPSGETPMLAGSGSRREGGGTAITAPDSGDANMPANPGVGDRRPGSNVPISKVDPFADLDPNRKPMSGVRNSDVDPFADLRPSEPERSMAESGIRNNERIPHSTGSRSNTYQPPVIQNKFDDTLDVAPETTPSNEEPKTNDQTTLLIVLGIIGVLLLVMIALLVAVLVKAKAPQPRRSIF